MSENINQSEVQNTLASKIEGQGEVLTNSDELKNINLAEGNIQVLKQILSREEGEDEAEYAAEQAALKTAIEETAAAHDTEGVSEPLIRMWIHGEDIGNSLDELGALNAETYAEILASPEASTIVQTIARQLDLDIGEGGEGEDGVDSHYGALTAEAVGDIQAALIKAGLLPENMEDGRSNQDGKFGSRTLAALRSAVTTEAAAAAVDEVAAAIPEGGAVATTTETVVPANALSELPTGSEIFGANEEEISTFATDSGVSFLRHNGVPSFMRPGGEFLTLEQALTNEDPKAFVAQWGEGEVEASAPEVTETDEVGVLSTEARNKLSTTLPHIAGVDFSSLNFENGTVQIFDGQEIPLSEVALGGYTVNPEQSYPTLRSTIRLAAESLVEDSDQFSFNRNGANQLSEPAHFTNQAGEIIFTLAELTNNQIDTDMPYTVNVATGRADALAGFREQFL